MYLPQLVSHLLFFASAQAFAYSSFTYGPSPTDDPGSSDYSSWVAIGSAYRASYASAHYSTGAAATATGASSSATTAAAAENVITKGVGGSVSYAINIPEPGSTDIFFQIQGPSSMQWIALGQGSQMAGGNMFIIYADSTGNNVTLSPRASTGEVEPTAASSSTVTLLEGSGISNSVMTANVLCTNCQSWSGGTMDFTSTSAPWLWAYKSDSPLSSDSKSAAITQHDNMGTLSVDLTAATGGSSSNPFLASKSSSSTAPGTSTDGVTIQQSANINDALAPVHGSLGFLSFAILFPLGAIVLRILSFRGVVWAHVAIQALSYLIAITVLGTGVYMANAERRLTQAHPIIGLVVIAALFLQPILGILHHRSYKSKGSSIWSLPHVWWGRILITLGIINGGLGLQLSATAGRNIEIAYGVVAGSMWLLWMGSALWVGWRKRKAGGHVISSGVDRKAAGDESESSGFAYPPMQQAMPLDDWREQRGGAPRYQ